MSTPTSITALYGSLPSQYADQGADGGWPAQPFSKRCGSVTITARVYSTPATYQVHVDHYPAYHYAQLQIELPIVGAQPMAVVDLKLTGPELIVMPSYRRGITGQEQDRLLHETLAMVSPQWAQPRNF